MEEDHLVVVCCCCDGAGAVACLDTCPLCDGHGIFGGDARSLEWAAHLQRHARSSALTFRQSAKLWVLDGFLRRLASSAHSESFVLRGSLLTRQLIAPKTRLADDLDFVAQFPWEGTGSCAAQRIRSISCSTADDGVCFAAEGLKSELIWEESDAPGVRVALHAFFFGERFDVQVDTAFGDPVQPAACWLDYKPVQGDTFQVLSVQCATMFAWKLHGLFEHYSLDEQGHDVPGRYRPKDVADLYHLSRSDQLVRGQLPKAIEVAFFSRGQHTQLINRVLNRKFGGSGSSQRMWRKHREEHPEVVVPEQLYEVIHALSLFLEPVCNEMQSFIRSRVNQAGLGENSEEKVTQLSGTADVMKDISLICVSAELGTCYALRREGNRVRFAGRFEEFTVLKILMPNARTKVTRLQVTPVPRFTARCCPVEVVCRGSHAEGAPMEHP